MDPGFAKNLSAVHIFFLGAAEKNSGVVSGHTFLKCLLNISIPVTVYLLWLETNDFNFLTDFDHDRVRYGR